ncbi:MAG: amidohydrolase family protein [Chloroflexota bacterium]|nr:MAG: amidohydrolase family protein [Chloroflexota bacterium]
MKSVIKWIGIAVAILVALGIIAYVAIYIYDPGSSAGWVKPGIAQEEIPAGVGTSVAFQNVTVIPMDSARILEGQTVVIEDRHIADIGASGDIDIPANTHVVDGEGKFLIPGLSDMHIHTSASENDLLVYLANGVTTVRDMGSESPVILEWRDQVRDGARVGPSIWAWWPSIENNQLWDEWGTERASRGGKTWVHTPEEAEQLVAEMAALGVDGIKAHVVDSSDIYLALLESASRHSLPFDGHVPEDHTFCGTGLDCWNDFRKMGVPALAHVEELVKMVELLDENSRQASDESIRHIAQDAANDGLWVSTSIYLMRSIADQAADLEGTLAAMPELKYVHPGVFDGMKWGPGENYYVAAGSRPWWPEYVAANEKMLLALSESGALLMSGTDASTPVLVPGFSLHDELETMADVGLSPYDVLRTSTYNPALYLGELDEFGTVEAGKRADLVLLEGNPLQDIANTRQIAGVMAQGRYYSRADLDLMLEAVAQDYEATKTTQSVIEIAFPIVVVLLLAALVWFILRRRKASQVSS